MATLDNLEIEITHESSKAVSSIKNLADALERLEQASKGMEKSLEGVNFTAFFNSN